MFYIRKPTNTNTVSLLREASAVELHNYKNRFVVKPPVDDDAKPGTQDCGCSHHGHKFDEMLFININCDLDLDNLGSKK